MRFMRMVVALAVLAVVLVATAVSFGQTPVALRTSDPKFAPRWVDVPAPAVALTLRDRYGGWPASYRPIGTFEVAYCLVDESWAISPASASVTISPTVTGWDIVGTTPGVPLWTRATGILWVFRQAGATTWKSLGCDQNRGKPWEAVKPFKAITGWEHSFGGQWLYPSAFPDLSDMTLYPASTVLTAAPPVPAVRLLECPNHAYDVAYSWACNQGETALSPILHVPAKPTDGNTHISLIRTLAPNVGQPPQGALGMYFYMRKPGGPWQRQPCPDGHTGNLWALDVVMLEVHQYVESGIQPGPTTGKSYLSSLHLALRDWNRDIIIDDDQVICCPLISEWNGASWNYQPQNHWIAVYGTTTAAGTWTLTIDGVTSGAMPRVNNLAGGWVQWQSILDAAFGTGNVKIGDFWPNYAPKIELTGKWSGKNMTGNISVQVKDVAGTSVDPAIVGTQVGRDWVLGNGGQTKFKRKISTSNAGNWKVQDAATTPNGVTGYPMGWPLWVEFSQRTKLVGCDFTMMHSNCGIATADNNGGGCFHFNPVECSVSPHQTNTRPVTFGFRCIGSSSWGLGGHLCSEPIMEKCHFNAKFPVVCEGQQAANWQIRDANCHSNGTFDSAIITQTNAGSVYCGGRFTADNARTLVASVWARKTTFENLWIDQSIPTLTNYNANSMSQTVILGGKINQWQGWIHPIESPAGTMISEIQKLVTDNLDSQTNGPVQARLCNPKAGQAVYAPRVANEVPPLLQSLTTAIAP